MPTSGVAFAKSQMAASPSLPESGDAFVSVKDGDKEKAIQIAKKLSDLGFGIIATAGTGGITQVPRHRSEECLQIE